MAVRWLVDNRTGGHWASTRQTANVTAALLAYAKAAKELTPDLTVTVDVDGKVKKSFHIDGTNALIFDNRFLVGDEILASGEQKLHLSMTGKGTLYWNSCLKYFDMSESIQSQSNAISVERKYYKIVPLIAGARHGKRAKLPTATVTNTNTNTNTNTDPVPDPDTDRIPLHDGAKLTSGDIVEVELIALERQRLRIRCV